MRNLPITDLGSVLRLDGCGKQKDMCWGNDGFVLAHKDVNPDFDEGKPFIVVIDHDSAWQMHFENFGTMPKNEKILDDMYRAVAASCEKGTELELRGGATPGGLSGFSKLRDYGFRKEPLPDDTPVYWGGELDPARLEKWLNSGRHDDDFLVRTDGDVEPGAEGGIFVSPREYAGKITAGNTKPRPFKMVRESNDEVRLKYYCQSFGMAPINNNMKKQASAFSVCEARRLVPPSKEWYSRITAEMV